MIPVAEPWLTERERENVLDALESGWISPKGEYVSDFESTFADFVGTEEAIATSTGTAALHLALLAVEVEPGDEVIVPDLTWIACANAVRYVGATPVFADIDEATLTMDPGSVRACISGNTTALLPVHLYGHPCDMDALLEIADEHDLYVIEDAAEAHGAEHDSRPVGSIGDLGCFSFYGNKILTTGQGGIVTTDDTAVAERLRLYRRDGMSTDRRYYHEVVGYNYRLTNLQAAVGVAQVERASEILAEKRRVARRYRERLADVPVRFPAEPAQTTPAYWLTVPIFESEADRDAVLNALSANDIETRPLFHPLHDQPPYRGTGACRLDAYPVATKLAKRGLNLPSAATLTDEKIDRVATVVEDALDGSAP